MTNDSVYFERRAQEERVAAMKATHPVARQRHVEMADAYEARARAIMADEARLAFHLVSAALRLELAEKVEALPLGLGRKSDGAGLRNFVLLHMGAAPPELAKG
jgi:hypothetical protein